jgi:sulfur-carrier protein adenylyltransferase/sulfurtransferase
LIYEPFPKALPIREINSFLNGPDIIIDSLDFYAIDMRQKIYDRALEKGIYVITAGPIGFGCSLVTFSPHSGMSFSEYFNFQDTDSPHDKQIKFTLGMNPNSDFFKNFTKNALSLQNGVTPSLGLACAMCASMATGEVLKIVTGRGELKSAPYWKRYDPFLNRFYECTRARGNRHPARKVKFHLYKYISTKMSSDHSQDQNEKPLPDTLPEAILPQDGEAHITSQHMEFLLQKGTLAISADNSQHWKFSHSDTSITIHEDPDRSNFNSSTGHLPQLISYGAVAENISIAASAINLNTNINFRYTRENPSVIAECKFTAGAKKDQLFDFLEHRHTNRLPYHKTPVPSVQIEKLYASIQDFTDINMHCYQATSEKGILTKITAVSDEMIWLTKSLHEDLVRWIRFDKHSQDGLPLPTLGLKLHKMVSLKAMQNFSTVQLMSKFGMQKVAAIKSHLLMSRSPMHVVFTVNNATPLSFFNAGRAIERFWILANSLNLSLQPFTSPIIILHKELFEGKGTFNPQRRSKTDQILTLWNSCFDLSDEIPVMLFRAGYAPLVEHRTKRRDITEMIIAPRESSADRNLQNRKPGHAEPLNPETVSHLH